MSMLIGGVLFSVGITLVSIGATPTRKMVENFNIRYRLLVGCLGILALGGSLELAKEPVAKVDEVTTCPSIK